MLNTAHISNTASANSLSYELISENYTPFVFQKSPSQNSTVLWGVRILFDYAFLVDTKFKLTLILGIDHKERDSGVSKGVKKATEIFGVESRVIMDKTQQSFPKTGRGH